MSVVLPLVLCSALCSGLCVVSVVLYSTLCSGLCVVLLLVVLPLMPYSALCSGLCVVSNDCVHCATVDGHTRAVFHDRLCGYSSPCSAFPMFIVILVVSVIFQVMPRCACTMFEDSVSSVLLC